MFRIGICDDDEQFSIQLEKHILEYARKNGISVDTQIFLCSEELFSDMNEDGLVELLFLDIELGEDTGVDVGKRIRCDLKNETMQIVYVSSKEEYALQLFDIRPMNFLIKPIDYTKVAYILSEYERLFGFQNRFFTYNIGKRKYSANENCILYFQSQGRKIHMITQEGEEEFYGKLSDVILQLHEQAFCVVHKSYIINMRYVAQYRSDSILMTNGDVIPVSESMKKNVQEKLFDNIL